jgi:hypothetical protein
MDELITRAAEAAGVEAGTARQAIGEIFAFLQKEADPQALQALMDKIPGANEAQLPQQEESGGGLGGLLGALGGGGLMGLAGKLMGLGLGMDEIQALGRELFAYAREQAGEETVRDVTNSVPGLSTLI